MTLREFFAELKVKNPVLYRFGWINVILFAIALVLFFADNTVITGINGWIKPMKFALSITIYAWTFAWLLQYLPAAKRTIISWGVVLCMAVENGLIFMQAARGVKSHFNVATELDGMIFGIMGLFILINTLLIVYTIILFFSQKIDLSAPLLWAWRAGLIFFFLGGISGGIMSTILHHTLGAPDGGPGLPFLNWSTVAGDIRSAHFITLHGLQAIPLMAVLFFKSSTRGVILAALAYLAFCLWLHWLAFSGIPLIAIG